MGGGLTSFSVDMLCFYHIYSTFRVLWPTIAPPTLYWFGACWPLTCVFTQSSSCCRRIRSASSLPASTLTLMLLWMMMLGSILILLYALALLAGSGGCLFLFLVARARAAMVVIVARRPAGWGWDKDGAAVAARWSRPGLVMWRVQLKGRHS